MTRKHLLIWLILGLAMTVVPSLLSSPYYISTLIFCGIYGLVCIGLCLLMGYAGQISIGQAGFMAIGAYTTALLTTKWDLSPWLALVAAAVVTGFIAWILGMPCLKLRGHYLAMATLAFGEIVYVVLNSAISLTGGPGGVGGIPPLNIGKFNFDSDLRTYYLVLAMVWIGVLLAYNLVNSRVGRALRSIHGGEMAANSLGVDTYKYKLQVFVLSAVYASVAGSLYAHFVTFISPMAFDLVLSIRVVTMVAIGGMGSIWGSLGGGAFLVILPEVLRTLQDYDVLVYGAILLLAMIFSPSGAAGLISELKGRWNCWCAARKESTG